MFQPKKFQSARKNVRCFAGFPISILVVGKALPPIEGAPGIEDGEGNQNEMGGGSVYIFFIEWPQPEEWFQNQTFFKAKNNIP